MKRRSMDSNVAGSSKSQNKDELELNSSVLKNNSKSSKRKRTKTANEDTPTKRSKTDINVAGPSTQNVNEKMELNSSDHKSDSTMMNTKSVDDTLPPEMLLEVLNNVPTDDLLKCRQVNHNWKDLSSQIMHHRADKVLRFRFEGGNFKRNITVKHCDLIGSICTDWYKCKSDTLTDLLDCFNDCKHLPYTSFDFGDLFHFENKDLKIFLSIWGKHILRLKIQVREPIKSIEMLKKVLLELVPNLKELEIQFDPNCVFTSSVKVVTTIQQAHHLFQKFQLPKLEVLLVDTGYRQYRGIVESILTAACNLKEFMYNINHLKRNDNRAVRDSITMEDLIMLHSLDKIQCLHTIEICLSEDIITNWTKYSKNLDLKLRTLHLSFKGIWGNQQLKLDATSVINQLLESSRVVLDKLVMEPIGLLPGVIFPKLEKLRILHLWKTPCSASSMIESTMFPQPFEMFDVFPNLKELEMHFSCTDNYFPLPLAPMPSIEVLRMYGGSSPKDKEKLMKMSPNVKSLLLADDSPFPLRGKETFPKGFQVIVNNLKKLETFGWVIWKMTHRELLHKLDAVTTGLPEDFCKKLAVKFRNKDKLSAKEIASVDQERKHSSILDLKDLKRMDVTLLFDKNAYVCMDEDGHSCDSNTEDSDCEGDCSGTEKVDEAGYDASSDFYKTGFTKVSEFLAFKLMPNLKIRTHIVMD